jgi:ferredoxin-type protein NapH
VTKTKILRIGTAALVILIIVSGAVGKLNYGGICSLDTWIISVTDPVVGSLLSQLGLWRMPITVTCPLGFLERSLAARELLPQWPSVLLVVLSVILLGRIFCAWVCPSVILRRVFRDNGGSKPQRDAAPKGGIWASYSSYAVLGGVLFASYLFSFPVFCLFCPIGLFFGFLFAVIRFFSLDSLGLELVLFPAMLVLELWVLRSWCRTICPLGALLSIIGNLNRFLRPVVRQDKCLTGKGINCQACVRVCPEGIDLGKKGSIFTPSSCTKCLACSDRCPAKAIEFRLWA